MKILLLILATFMLQSCGGSKGGGTPSSPTREVPNAYTAEEEAFARTLSICNEEFQKQADPKDSQLDLLTMGYLGQECLQEKNTEKLKTILKAYQEYRESKNVDWKKLSRNTLKMEQL